MKYIIQAHLEHKEDVIRNIEIASENTLEKLHLILVKSFNLNENEIASFYKTNSKLDLLEEFTLFNIHKEDKNSNIMSNIKISDILKKKDDQLLYINNFLEMWRFLITLTSIEKKLINKSRCIKKIGEMPVEAPKINFEPKKRYNPFDEAFDDYEQDDNYQY